MIIKSFIKEIIQILTSPLGVSVLVVLATSCYYTSNHQNKTIQKLARLILISIGFYSIAIFSTTVLYRLQSEQVWDFSAFYLWGKIAALDYNFYSPENSQLVFKSLEQILPSNQYFSEAIVNVGFWYPPPSMFYFLPLGYFSYDTALFIWTFFTLIFLAGSVYLIFDLFFKTQGFFGFLFICILLLLYPSVKFTLICSQTNYIVLVLLLLLYKYADSKYAGILLTLAIFTKPYLIIFGFILLLSKSWKSIAYFIGSSSILSGLSILAFGFETFFSYFFDNPTQRIPAWVYSEDVNQSLNAVLIRSNLISTETPAIYIMLISAIVFVSIFAIFRLLKKEQKDGNWAILLLVGLLIYPGTLSYYGVALLFVMFQLFNTKNQLGLNSYLVIPAVGLLYYLDSFSLFSSICFLLITVSAILWRNLNSGKTTEKTVLQTIE